MEGIPMKKEMKRMGAACFLAAALLLGGVAEAAQPGLSAQSDYIRMEEAERSPVKAKVPVLTVGTALQRARVNAAVEAEISRFYEDVSARNAIAPVEGWVAYDVGMVSRQCVSLVLYESVMYKGAAHPSTVAVGMTFDKNGNHITRQEVMKNLPEASGDAIRERIKAEAARRNLFLFPETDWSVTDWPKSFYIGSDGHTYFLFQQYEIAPYAAGIIAIPAN